MINYDSVPGTATLTKTINGLGPTQFNDLGPNWTYKFSTNYVGVENQTSWTFWGVSTQKDVYSKFGILNGAGLQINYDSVFGVSNFINIYKTDSAIFEVISNKTFKPYIDETGYTETYTSSSSISSDFIKSHKTGLYILQNNSIYRIPFKPNGNTLIPIVTNQTVLGFYIDRNNKIWFTTSNALNCCDIDGLNQVLNIKTGNQFNSNIRMFVVTSQDTSFVYRKNSNQLYVDSENTYIPMVAKIATDTIKDLIIDKNDNVLFSLRTTMLNSVIDTSYFLYKIQMNDTSVTIFKNKYNYFVVDPDSVESAIVGRGNKLYFYHLNFRPVLSRQTSITEIGSVNNRITYKCTLNVTDDNILDSVYYYQASLYSWITFSSTFLHNAPCYISVDNKYLDTGTYTISFLAKSSGASVGELIDWKIHVFKRDIKVLNKIDTITTEDQLYLDTINLSDADDSIIYVSSKQIPSWLTISRISNKSFKIQGIPSKQLDTTIRIIFTDSTQNIDPFTGIKFNQSYDSIKTNLKINHVNHPLVISNNDTTINMKLSDQLNIILKINDLECDSITVSLKSKAQSGASIYLGNLQIIPIAEVNDTILVIATDSSKTSDTMKIILIVTANTSINGNVKNTSDYVNIKTDRRGLSINYGLTQTSTFTMKIFNLQGKEIKTISKTNASGSYSFSIGLITGKYIYKMNLAKITKTNLITIIQ
jgi:hypothetical protein